MTYVLKLILKEGALNDSLFKEIEKFSKQVTRNNNLMVYHHNDGNVGFHVDHQGQAIECGTKLQDLFNDVIVSWDSNELPQ